MKRFLFVSVTLILAGCGSFGGSNDSVVTGKVIGPDGKPLGGGQITLVSALDKNKGSGTTIRPDGTFTIIAAPKGDCLVAVETESIRPLVSQNGPKAPKGTPVIPPTGGMTAPFRYTRIDGRYAKPETSGLKITITGSKTQWDVHLK